MDTSAREKPEDSFLRQSCALSHRGKTMRSGRIMKAAVIHGILFCLVTLCSSGCGAFRWGEKSYQEVEQQNQDQRELEKRFKPDETFERK